MASQAISAAKRYRMSLLLDAYGELLTDKQRTFIRHYYEEDLSFGEIAREYHVSRQAIFDSVKHGEEALENFERVLGLVDSGWTQWSGAALNPRQVAQRIVGIRATLNGDSTVAAELEKLADQLGAAPAKQADELDTDDTVSRGVQAAGASK